MSHAAWTCVYCDTNNSGGDERCRVCWTKREKAAGAVPTPPATVPRPVGAGERPVFVESRHATKTDVPPPSRVRVGRSAPASPPRAGRTKAPAAPEVSRVRTAPPAPPAPPHRRSGGGRRVRRLSGWLLAALVAGLVVGNWSSIVTSLPDGFGSSGGSGTTATARACPPEAAKWLPDGGAGAVLEVAYTTPRHVITVCRSASGQLFYDGQLRGRPPSGETHISIPATRTGAGYSARNVNYLYEIVGSEVIVSHNGIEKSRQPLTRTGP